MTQAQPAIVSLRHGHSPKRGPRSLTYRSWQNMIARCRNPKNDHFRNYGGRGVMVCDRWVVFANFLADVGERPSAAHSLDRVRVDGHYEHGNVRWATKSEQQNNTRQCHYVEIDGERLTTTQAAARFGLKRETLRDRLRRGVPVMCAVGRKAG